MGYLLPDIFALLAFIAGLIGFVSTAILAWRKERRESVSHAHDLEKAKLEIESLRRQMDQGTAE